MSYKTHPYIEDYFNLIDTGEIVVCKEQLLLRDYVIRKLSQPGIYIDAEKIEKAIETKEKYFYKEFPFQKFIDCFVYGVFYEDGSLVFNKYFIMMGRGNGKNGYVSPSAWFLTTHYNNIKRYNVEIVATSEDQAKISFDDIFHMLEDNWEKLKKMHTKTKEMIAFKLTGSEIRWRTSNAKTKDGLRPGCIIFDEVHAYEDYSNINVFTSALGKVPCPRTFILTTDGYVRGSVLDDYKAEALEVLNGERPESRLFPFICKLDDKTEIDNPKMWGKANPAIYYMPVLKNEITEQYTSSLNNPELRLEITTKRFNIPAQDTITPVTDWENIAATNQEFPDCKGYECIGGVDYAETTDYVGVGLLFKKNGKLYWKHHTFICNESLLKAKPKINIEECVAQGLCTIIYDKLVHADIVANWFLEQSKNHCILRVACDRYRESIMRDAFDKVGIPLEININGGISQSKIAPLLDVKFANHEIVYGEDMLMRWYTNNTYAQKDGKGNRTYLKIEPVLRKNDGFMAFIAALIADNRNPIQEAYEVDFSAFRIRTY